MVLAGSQRRRCMLARRIIPVILYRGTETFKGEGFESWRRIGNLRQAVRVYQNRNVDELIILDISGSPPNVDLVRSFAEEMFMPLCVGGGISTLEQIKDLISNGADKVAINTAAVVKPSLITEAAEKFGRQAITVSMDVKHGTVWTRSGTHDTGELPETHARHMERAGAGELLVTAIERDGTLNGYDLDLVASIAKSVSIPVIACGGAGTYEHMKQAIDAGAHAVAAGALWNFTDSTPAGAAAYLAENGIPTRQRIAV